MINPLGNVAELKKFKLRANIDFYRTNLFLIFIILAVCLLAGLSFYLSLRIKNIENKTKERIAMDLHDEVGTTLTRLLMSLNKIPYTSPQYESLKFGLNEALFSIRAFINSMNGQKLDIYSFEDDIKEFTNKAFKDSEINYNLKSNLIENFKIEHELYRDMKLCIYESISNIVKHSNAKNVSIELSVANKTIFIKINDDSDTKLSDIHFNYGNGMLNMKKRAERHGGSFFLTKNELSGIEILFYFSFSANN